MNSLGQSLAFAEITKSIPPRRWETPNRYYLACVQHDLFGELLLSRCWGGKGSRLGNQRHEVMQSLDEAGRRMNEVNRIRLRHGYREVCFGE